MKAELPVVHIIFRKILQHHTLTQLAAAFRKPRKIEENLDTFTLHTPSIPEQ